MPTLALDILQVGSRAGMGMAHMGDKLLIADAGLFQDAFADLALMGIVVPPAQIETEQVKLKLRIAAAKEKTGRHQRTMDAFRRVMRRAAPGAGIDIARRGDIGPRHADFAFELRLQDHQIGKIFLVHRLSHLKWARREEELREYHHGGQGQQQ